MNTIPWPETHTLPKVIDKMMYYLTQSPEDKSIHDDLYQTLFVNPSESSIKIDGTNFGIKEDNVLLGRRTEIEHDVTSYLKTPVDHLRKVQVIDIKKNIEQVASVDLTNYTLVLYGELVCNNIYDYQSLKLFKEFVVFGAILKSKSELDAETNEVPEQEQQLMNEITDKMNAKNIISRMKTNFIQIFNSEYLRNICTQHNLKTNFLSSGSVYDIVKQHKQEMIECKYEGLVIQMKSYKKDKFFVSKWKSVMEPQGTNPDVLKKAIEFIQTNEFTKSKLDDTDYHFKEMLDLFNILLEVSLAKKVGKKKPQKEKEQKSNVVDPNEQIILDHLKSARTKYDPEIFYKKNDIKGLVQAYEKEIVDDMTKDMQVTKKINSLIKKLVSRDVGEGFKAYKESSK